MFAGVLYRASATVLNIGASMWIMDPSVQTVANTIGMPDYVLDAARSMQGVSYAVPLYSGGALVKLSDGTYQAVNILGLDDKRCTPLTIVRFNICPIRASRFPMF
jgi:putative ABC transport system permease protein